MEVSFARSSRSCLLSIEKELTFVGDRTRFSLQKKLLSTKNFSKINSSSKDGLDEV